MFHKMMAKATGVALLMVMLAGAALAQPASEDPLAKVATYDSAGRAASTQIEELAAKPIRKPRSKRR